MPRRALIDRRPWLLASLAAAIAYWLLGGGPLGELWLALFSGGAVLALACYAGMRLTTPAGRLLATALVLGALGAVAGDLFPTVAQTLLFGEWVALLMLFLPRRRAMLLPADSTVCGALLLGPPAIAVLMTGVLAAALYALTYAAMAAAAWASDLPRGRVGAGAVLLVANEMLTLAWLGPLFATPWPALLGWPLFYAGQFLIATGVVQTLRRRG